jgi:hypothetical protein
MNRWWVQFWYTISPLQTLNCQIYHTHCRHWIARYITDITVGVCELNQNVTFINCNKFLGFVIPYFKVEKQVNAFMKNPNQKHFKYPPMEKIERSIM